MSEKPIRVTPLGTLVLILFAAGLVLLFATSGTASLVGFVLVFISGALIIASGLTIRSGTFAFMTLGRADTRPFDGEAVGEDYIEQAATPSEEVWQREEQRYREHEEERAKERPDEP